MATLIEIIVEKRVNALLEEVEEISKEYIECQQKETNSIIEITTLSAIPKYLERKILVINTQLKILNMMFNTKGK